MAQHLDPQTPFDVEALTPLSLLEAVQSLAIERSPLWKVLARAEDLLPAISEVTRRYMAGHAVLQLVERGAIELVWIWGNNAPKTRSIAASDEQDSWLDDPANWREKSADDLHLEIHAISS
ncbi:MAG: hypothetical protein AB7E79_12265 [Rhodospirillaceae bacterium]